MDEMILAFQLPDTALGHLTSAVQLGFISGTLLFALLAIADRFSPSKVFFFSAFLGGLFNLGMMWEGNGLEKSFGFPLFHRLLFGRYLSSGHENSRRLFRKRLGCFAGLLGGGSGPWHGLSSPPQRICCRPAVEFGHYWHLGFSAVLGGLLLFALVPDGPYRKAAQQVNLKSAFQVFKDKPFRSAAFGYFGHMWELYAFWAFVPYIITQFNDYFPDLGFPVSLLSCHYHWCGRLILCNSRLPGQAVC